MINVEYYFNILEKYNRKENEKPFEVEQRNDVSCILSRSPSCQDGNVTNKVCDNCFAQLPNF